MVAMAELSTWMWILILGIAMFPIVIGSKSKCAHRKKPIIFASIAVLALLGGVMLFSIGDRPAPPDVKWAYIEEGGKPKLTEYAKAAHSNEADPSLEALWEKLTRSRINLDGDAAQHNGESTDTADEKNAPTDSKAPTWVTNPPKRVGQVLPEVVSSDLFVTKEECRRQLESEQIPSAVARQIGYLASARTGESVTVASPLAVGIGLDYIFGKICRDEYTETVDSSVGEMKKVHVLLEFNPEVNKHLVNSWLRWERQKRLATFGKIAALSLSGLAAVYGLLRFDTWSKGYYTRELLFGSVLAIIAIAVFMLRT